jgi:hypothetical protein
VFVEAGLGDVEEIVADVEAALLLLGGGGVLAPLAEASHLLWEIELLAALGLDDPDGAGGVAGDEVGRVVGEIAIGLDVVKAEADGEVVLGESLAVGSVPEEAGEGEFEAAAVGFADDAIEERILGGDEGAILGAERAGEFERDAVFSVNMPCETEPEASKRRRSNLSRPRRTSWSQMAVSTASRWAK